MNISGSTIAILSNPSQYTNWKIRVKAFLITKELWNTKAGCPVDSDAAASYIVSFLSDDVLSEVRSSDMKAITIWNLLDNNYVRKDLANKSMAISALMNFHFDEPTMRENETKLVNIQKELELVFNNTTISFAELVSIRTLSSLPPEYQSLRTSIEENSANIPDLQTLFSSLKREETHLLNVNGQANRTSSNPRQQQAQQTQQKKKKSPPVCKKCQDMNIERFNHHTDSDYCKFQQFMYKNATESKSNRASESKSNRAVRFNVDSGTSDTLIGNKDEINIYSKILKPIQTANGQFMNATAIGSVPGASLTLQSALLCPDVAENLLSVARLEDQGLDTLFSKGKVYVGRNAIMNDIVVSGERQNSSYYLEIERREAEECKHTCNYSSDAPIVSSKAFLSNIDEVHLKFNHLNEKDLLRLVKENLTTDLTIDCNSKLSCCESCLIGKSRKGTTPKVSTFKSTRIGELIHTDVCGPINPKGKSGARFFLTFVDDYSRFVTLFCLKSKDEVYAKFHEFDA